jgi:hypothetical protein
VSDKVDLHDEITAICDKLGYEPGFVYLLRIEPDKVTVHAYDKHPTTGHKYVDEDTSQVVTHTKTVPIES